MNQITKEISQTFGVKMDDAWTIHQIMMCCVDVDFSEDSKETIRAAMHEARQIMRSNDGGVCCVLAFQ
jgi:hypothetical protein